MIRASWIQDVSLECAEGIIIFVSFLIAKIARMNCFSALFSFQTCTDRDGYGVADTIFCRCKATPEHPTKKHGLNIAGHICGQWGLILASVYSCVIGMCGKIGRMHALLKDKRPSFSLSVSAHLTAIVCIFRSRLSQFKHNYAYVSHTPSVTSSYGEEMGEKRKLPGQFCK